MSYRESYKKQQDELAARLAAIAADFAKMQADNIRLLNLATKCDFQYKRIDD